MDRETQDQYLVLLQAKDMGGHLGGLSGTTTVTVKLSDVNDNPPRFTQSESYSSGAVAGGGGVGGREETGQNSNYSVTWCDNALLMGAVGGSRRGFYYLTVCVRALWFYGLEKTNSGRSIINREFV